MVSEERTDRIADRIQRELTMMFLHEINDPRLNGVTITEVDVDRELAFADVFVSAPEGPERKDEIMGALSRAAGFIRSQLAGSISHLRTFPQLRFRWDPVPERLSRLDQIFSELEDEGEFEDLDE